MSNITLEDVETAIKIIELFLEKLERARRVMYRLRRYQSRGGFRMPTSMQDWINYTLQEAMARKNMVMQQAREEYETIELSEEERKRLEEIKEKIKKGEIKPLR